MTDQTFLPFAQPEIGEEEIAEVVDALRSGWITTGPKTRAFEAAFSEYLGGGVQAIAVNSATAGLHLALEALGVGPGDEVMVPSFTFTATAEVVRYLGADPVFVDIDETTFNIDPAEIERKLTPKTKGLVVVHFAGMSADMKRVVALARNRGLFVVEDAAHAFPATHGGVLIGALESDLTVFSFYATKTLATGEGGMVVTRDRALADRCKIMRLHGISRDAFDRYVSKEPSWYYEVVAPGYKYNMTDVAAAIGIHQLRKARRFQSRRQEIAREYDEALAPLGIRIPPRPDGSDLHAWHLYVIRLDDRGRDGRADFIERMAQEGVGCSVHFIPLHIQPYWRDAYRLRPEDCPGSLAVYDNCVSLPIYTKMVDSDVDRVVRAVKKCL